MHLIDVADCDVLVPGPPLLESSGARRRDQPTATGTAATRLEESSFIDSDTRDDERCDAPAYLNDAQRKATQAAGAIAQAIGGDTRIGGEIFDLLLTG